MFSVNVAHLQPTGTEDYVPAGVMAVPRSQQVSAAVFEQEDNLKAVSTCFVLFSTGLLLLLLLLPWLFERCNTTL